MSRITDTLAALDRRIDGWLAAFRIKHPLLKRLVSLSVFLIALHLFYSHIGVYAYIHERPCSIHASAQCQRASIAQNYYQVDMNFFKPRIQRFAGNDGITGVEFPIIYYTAAVLYKCFGFNDAFLRIISLLVVSAGFLFFYLLANRFLKNSIFSMLITLSAVFSPVLLYYSANFMPDAPALGFTLMAWYFLMRYAEDEKNSSLILFVACATMGGLIKSISVMCFLVVFCLLVLDVLNVFKNGGRVQLFKHKLKLLLGLIVGLAIVVSWYAYAKWLTAAGGNNSFNMGTVIVQDKEGLALVYEMVSNVWLFQYYSYETYVLLLSALAFVVLTIRKANRVLVFTTLFYLLGSACYVYLFLTQFRYHDYYVIAVLPCAFFMLLLLADGIRKLSLRVSYLLGFAFAVVLVFNMKECIVNCKENYFYRYNSRIYLGGDYRPYYDLAPRLKELGLTRKDKVVSAFDDSYSNSLYFMDQPGYTVEGCYVGDTIQHAIDAPGVRYLVVNDSAKFNKVFPNNFSKQVVLTHRGLFVYKLK